MFNLFKKKNRLPSSAEVITKVQAMHNDDPLLFNGDEWIGVIDEDEEKKLEPQLNPAQIAIDVHAAQAAILNKANEILAMPPLFEKEKEERLQNLICLGFTGMKEHKTLENEKYRAACAAHLKETAEYYALHYPMHKFIDDESLKTICNKYGLILTIVGRYKDKIPLKNQQEILNFKVKHKDIREPYDLMRRRPIFDTSHFVFAGNHLRKAMSEKYGIPDTEENRVKLNELWDNNWDPGTHLCIIAPPSKINTEDMRISGHRLIDKDPFILQPVKEVGATAAGGLPRKWFHATGYLIVTGWLEDEDPAIFNEPSLQNPKHN